MPWRFSLKWLLLGTAYLAVALVAMLQRSDGALSVLWITTGAFLLWLVLVVCFHRGANQAAALGCLLFLSAATFLHCKVPHRSPLPPIKEALGVDGALLRTRQADLERRLEQLAWQNAATGSSLNPEYLKRVSVELKQAEAAQKRFFRLRVAAHVVDAFAILFTALGGAVVGARVAKGACTQSPSSL